MAEVEAPLSISKADDRDRAAVRGDRDARRHPRHQIDVRRQRQLHVHGVAAIAGLCALAVACRKTTPDLAEARWIEPRLTGASRWQPCNRTLPPGRMVERVDCPAGNTPSPPVSSPCDAVTTDAMSAIRTLISMPRCIDEAVARLKSAAESGAGAEAGRWNDLACGTGYLSIVCEAGP